MRGLAVQGWAESGFVTGKGVQGLKRKNQSSICGTAKAVP